jgi:hypothetical protein
VLESGNVKVLRRRLTKIRPELGIMARTRFPVSIDIISAVFVT